MSSTLSTALFYDAELTGIQPRVEKLIHSIFLYIKHVVEQSEEDPDRRTPLMKVLGSGPWSRSSQPSNLFLRCR